MTPDEERMEVARCLAPNHDEYAIHYFSECGVCGWLAWATSHKELPDGVAPHPEGKPVIQISPEIGYGPECPRCADAYRRAPELVEWVIGCLGRQSRVQR